MPYDKNYHTKDFLAQTDIEYLKQLNDIAYMLRLLVTEMTDLNRTLKKQEPRAAEQEN